MIQSGMDALSRESSIRWVQELVGADHVLLFRLLSVPGSSWGILLAVAIAAWWFGRRDALAVAAATAVTAPLRLLLAALFAVPRPDPSVALVAQPEIGSFPSGHVLHAVVAWGVLAAMTRVPTWTAVAAVLATAVSRVYLGAHFPADVLASLVLGPLIVWAFLVVWRRVESRLPGSTGPWPAAAGVGAAVLVVIVIAATPTRPEQWEVVGLVAGGLGVLGARGSRVLAAAPQSPRPTSPWRASVPVLGALAGTAWLIGPVLPWTAGVATGAAVLWVFLGGPAPAAPLRRA